MAIGFIPRVVYGTGPTTFDFTLPQKLWTPWSRAKGGSNVSDSGIPEAFIVRRDQLVDLELRFYESEWGNVLAFLSDVQNGNQFNFYFDKTNLAGTLYVVYLESPELGKGEIKPTREGFPRVFNIPVTLRSINGTPFNIQARS